MPITYWTFLVATIAIAGIFPFAGFFSKDEILAKAFTAGYTDLNGFSTVYSLLWVLAVAGAVLTAFYMFRLVYMTFHGEFRGGHEAEHHLHESPWTMTMPLQVLGVLSIVGGFLGFPGQLFGRPELNRIEQFLEPVILPIGAIVRTARSTAPSTPRPTCRRPRVRADRAVARGGGLRDLARLPLLLRCAGERAAAPARRALPLRLQAAAQQVLGRRALRRHGDQGQRQARRPRSGTVDARVVDGAVNGTRHVTVGSSFLSGIFDLRVVDGAVNLIARAYDVASVAFRRLQVGFTQGYAMVMVFGAAILLVVFLVSSLGSQGCTTTSSTAG